MHHSAVEVTHVPSRVPTRLGEFAVWRRPSSGTPVVLWPSLFTDHTVYNRLVRSLDETWAPVLIDGPGFGASDPPLPRVQPDRYAAAVRDVIDALDLARVGFAGTSWGGQIGAHLAADHPDRVAWALLANTPVGRVGGSSVVPVFAAAAIGPTRFYGRRVAAAMLSPSSQSQPDVREPMVGRFPTFGRSAMARTAATTLRHFPGVVDEVKRAQVPVTVLMGADDRLYPPATTCAALAGAPPLVQFVELPGCGHLAPLEAPGKVAAELGRLRQRAGR